MTANTEHLIRKAFERVPNYGMVFFGAENNSNWWVFTVIGPMFSGIIEVKMHLPGIRMGEFSEFQVNGDETPQFAMKKDEIDPIPFVADSDALRIANAPFRLARIRQSGDRLPSRSR